MVPEVGTMQKIRAQLSHCCGLMCVRYLAALAGGDAVVVARGLVAADPARRRRLRRARWPALSRLICAHITYHVNVASILRHSLTHAPDVEVDIIQFCLIVSLHMI